MWTELWFNLSTLWFGSSVCVSAYDKVQNFCIYWISTGLSKLNCYVFPVVTVLDLVLLLLYPCQLCLAAHLNSCLARLPTASAIWSSKIHIIPHSQLAYSASPSHKFLKVVFITNIVCGLFLLSIFLKAPLFSSTTHTPAMGCEYLSAWCRFLAL